MEMFVVQVEVYRNDAPSEEIDEHYNIASDYFGEVGIELKNYGDMWKAFQFIENDNIFNLGEFKSTFEQIVEEKDYYGIKNMYYWIWEMDTDEPNEYAEG